MAPPSGDTALHRRRTLLPDPSAPSSLDPEVTPRAQISLLSLLFAARKQRAPLATPRKNSVSASRCSPITANTLAVLRCCLADLSLADLYTLCPDTNAARSFPRRPYQEI